MLWLTFILVKTHFYEGSHDTLPVSILWDNFIVTQYPNPVQSFPGGHIPVPKADPKGEFCQRIFIPQERI